MDLLRMVENERNKLDQCTSAYEKLNIYNNIIQLKSLNTNLKSTLFQDIKQYLICTIGSVEETAYQYYELTPKQIISTIELLPITEQLNLLRFFDKQLKENGFEENITWLKKLIKSKKIAYLRQNLSFTNSCKIAFEASTYNLATVIASLLIVFFLYTAALFPAPFSWMVCFKSNLVKYHNSQDVNIFLNSLLSFCGIDSDFKFNPINCGGVILLIILKLLVAIVTLKYLFDEIKGRIKLS